MVVSTASEALTADDVLAHRKHLSSDPGFDPSFDQVMDLTAVRNVKLSNQEIRTFAAGPLFSRQSRRAIVALTPEVYGMARMFQQYRELSPDGEIVKVFQSLNEAEKWINEKTRPKS